jgi:hypothetical protein
MHALLHAGSALADARALRVEQQLKRFRPEVRSRVMALAYRHPWIADLAVSFPALIFALAFPRRGVDARAALRLVLNGTSLPSIATAAGVASWLRTFPPEAFKKSIPPLPDSHFFRRRIVNHFPRRWHDAPHWVDGVSLAGSAGSEELALWFAREAPAKPPKKYRRSRNRRPDNHRLVILWAWFSTQPETAAHKHLVTPWRAEMNWNAAVDAALVWRNAVALSLYLGDGAIEDAWLSECEVDGFSFVPLRTCADVVAEAVIMRNCVRGYGSSLAGNDLRLWSMRKGGERVATLALSGGIGPLPYISELSLAENKEAPLAFWLAARRWLHAHEAGFCDGKRLQYKDAAFDAPTWRALWRPYWLAKRRLPHWLPLCPSPTVFFDL